MMRGEKNIRAGVLRRNAGARIVVADGVASTCPPPLSTARQARAARPGCGLANDLPTPLMKAACFARLSFHRLQPALEETDLLFQHGRFPARDTKLDGLALAPLAILVPARLAKAILCCCTPLICLRFFPRINGCTCYESICFAGRSGIACGSGVAPSAAPSPRF